MNNRVTKKLGIKAVFGIFLGLMLVSSFTYSWGPGNLPLPIHDSFVTGDDFWDHVNVIGRIGEQHMGFTLVNLKVGELPGPIEEVRVTDVIRKLPETKCSRVGNGGNCVSIKPGFGTLFDPYDFEGQLIQDLYENNLLLMDELKLAHEDRIKSCQIMLGPEQADCDLFMKQLHLGNIEKNCNDFDYSGKAIVNFFGRAFGIELGAKKQTNCMAKSDASLSVDLAWCTAEYKYKLRDCVGNPFE